MCPAGVSGSGAICSTPEWPDSLVRAASESVEHATDEPQLCRLWYVVNAAALHDWTGLLAICR